jgi:hypothetical protein
MTRQFNQQPRDDSRSPSHHIPSSRYEEQQSARPARPRLNRAMVDRGWENGSPRRHADYRPRVSSGQAPQKNWRKNQEAGDSSYNGPTGNRTNANHRAQPSFQPSSAPRQRPFESKGYNAENRRSRNQHQENEPYGYNNQRPPQGRGSDYHQSQRRSNEYRNNRSQPDRESANGYGNNRFQPNSEQDKGKGHRNFDGRSRYSDQEQRPPHPRFQSRPETFRGRQDNRNSMETQPQAPYREQFKGDYEQFGYDTPAQAASGPRKPFGGSRRDRYQPYPNAKGPRLVQRKETEFRASINEDAEELINRVHSSPDEQSKTHQGTASLPETTIENSASEDQPQTLPEDKQTKSSLTNEQAKPVTSREKTKKAEVVQPVSKGPRPSQRGYKWPKP